MWGKSEKRPWRKKLFPPLITVSDMGGEVGEKEWITIRFQKKQKKERKKTAKETPETFKSKLGQGYYCPR